MDLREDALGDIGVVEILGRIDSTTAPTLGERLTGILGARKALVLDLRQLEYISSAGFRVLLLAAKHADTKASTTTATKIFIPTKSRAACGRDWTGIVRRVAGRAGEIAANRLRDWCSVGDHQ